MIFLFCFGEVWGNNYNLLPQYSFTLGFSVLFSFILTPTQVCFNAFPVLVSCPSPTSIGYNGAPLGSLLFCHGTRALRGVPLGRSSLVSNLDSGIHNL